MQHEQPLMQDQYGTLHVWHCTHNCCRAVKCFSVFENTDLCRAWTVVVLQGTKSNEQLF